MRRHGWTSRLLFLIATAWGAAASGAGADFQVNSYTTGNQIFPAISLSADGDFVVVWHSSGSSGSDTDGYSIQGQRYAADGSAQGGQFQVNTYTTSAQTISSVALDADGDFVVVWQSSGSSGGDTSLDSIQGQRYAANGTPLGGQFQVNTYTTGLQRVGSVSLAADGDFVVVWASNGSSGGDTSNFSIQGQRYAADGSAQGGQFQVNTYTTSSQFYPAVSLSAEGGFVVVWASNGSSGGDTASYSIQGQRYAADGAALGSQFQVNTYTTGSQTSPSVSLDGDGDFVVVWQSGGSSGGDTSNESVQGQRYAANGAALGGQFQVNTYTTNPQKFASVSLAADGDFVVAWQSYGSGSGDTSFESVQGQRYSSNGAVLGGEFQVNAYTTGHQGSPSVSLDADGNYVVAWQSDGSSGSDTSSFSIQGQRYAVVIFIDGFESGDASLWSTTVP